MQNWVRYARLKFHGWLFICSITQHQKINNNSISILRIKEIDLEPLWSAELEFDGSKALWCFNVPPVCLYEWLEERLKFNCARILQNFKSPLISSSFKMLQTGTDSLGSKSNIAQWCFRIMNWSREVDCVWRIWKKIWEKKFEELDLDLKIMNPPLKNS